MNSPIYPNTILEIYWNWLGRISHQSESKKETSWPKKRNSQSNILQRAYHQPILHVPDLLQRLCSKNRGKLSHEFLGKNSNESRWLDIQEKGMKHQKMEGIILYDVVAESEDDDLSSAPFFIQGFLETRAIALALTKIRTPQCAEEVFNQFYEA